VIGGVLLHVPAPARARVNDLRESRGTADVGVEPSGSVDAIVGKDFIPARVNQVDMLKLKGIVTDNQKPAPGRRTEFVLSLSGRQSGSH
jgi:hypothetical protein